MKKDENEEDSAASNQSIDKTKGSSMKALSNYSIRKNQDSMKHLSNQSFRMQSRSSLSSSVRRLDSISSSRRGQKRLSRIQENVTVITTCDKDPDVCVLCGSGIPSSRCVSCDGQGHNKCIEAFFCTLDKKVNLASWKCPKCVTMHNMKNVEKQGNVSLTNDVESVVKDPEPECPFCRIDMDFKNCQCEECLMRPKGVSKLKKCTCEQPQVMRYNKCLYCRETGAVCNYMSLRDDGKEMVEEEGSRMRIFWSVIWCVLLVTLAFPIAIISAHIFIFAYCFESCFDDYSISNFFLRGMKLPGKCCRGMLSGTPM